MKQINLFLFAVFFFTGVYSQPLPDSIKTKYMAAKTDEQKGRCLYTYLGGASTADSIVTVHALDLLSWLKKQNDIVGANYTELFIANVLVFKSDYSTSLNMALSILSRFEKSKDNYGIMASNYVVGLAYMFAKNYEQAIKYLKKVVFLAQTLVANYNLSKPYNDLGVAYALASMPDSGLLYAQKSVNLDKEMKNHAHLPVSLSTVAENYMAAKEYDIAIPFLRKSMEYYLTQKDNQNKFGIMYVNNDFAQAFIGKNQYDSATYYAHLSIQLSGPLGYKEQTLRSYEYLYKSFEETKKQDSVNKYFRLAMTAKDSLFSMEKTRNIQAMSFREQIREQEIEAEQIQKEEERKQNIQFALIAFSIITFVIIFLLLSRSFITNTKMIEFLGVIALLIVFEFLNLLLHPFLERITNHSPIVMLLALVCIAALLVPLHHKAEKWATAKLVEKNKKIRLAAAKKTIEQLEK